MRYCSYCNTIFPEQPVDNLWVTGGRQMVTLAGLSKRGVAAICRLSAGAAGVCGEFLLPQRKHYI
ncbi:hypothetical protein SAMN05216296_0794 [Pseudomonas pohangensis]|uniref:Uncharacterized protein n=1 Tax=Pseudomonas pohangensis TaxID=364197 RepID=A0A1H2EI20_9PSED|nr:hypothetical protein SAMN05216296_0794 [Pseudomonas pohangensis]